MDSKLKRKIERNEHRRLKLLGLIRDQCGGVNAVLAKKLGKEPSYINRLLYPEGKPGKKNIGDEIMDAVIDAYNFPENWWVATNDSDNYGIDLSYATVEKINHIKKVSAMENDEFRETVDVFDAADEVVKARKRKKDE